MTALMSCDYGSWLLITFIILCTIKLWVKKYTISCFDIKYLLWWARNIDHQVLCRTKKPQKGKKVRNVFILFIEMYERVDSTPKKNNKQIFGIYVRTQQSTQMVAYASIKILKNQSKIFQKLVKYQKKNHYICLRTWKRSKNQNVLMVFSKNWILIKWYGTITNIWKKWR